ncbi:MAG: hypothetical protein M0P73_13935 [Syntrophobacterales bacterium]|jgi:nucleoside phosphorylase|nr:hypothetical protein [Syntrophobacterales bacterium]
MAALPQEVRPFLRRMPTQRRRDLGLPAWEVGIEAVAALSGMGRAAVRRAGETLVAGLRPALLVSVGFGGALTPELAPGDLILGETFWDYDPDTRELAARPAPPPPEPLPVFCRALEAAGFAAAPGSLVTTTRIIAKGREGQPLSGLARPVLDLETSVLAGVAAACGLPFLSLRAITDMGEEEIPGFLHGLGDRQAAAGAGAALRWLAGDLRRARDLARLWGRSRLAGRALAGALTALWPLLLAAGRDLEDQPG